MIQDQEILIARLSVLSDKSRFHILQLLAQGAVSTCCDRIQTNEEGFCVADVVVHTGLSQPTVSHHLKALEKVGLIRREVRGPWTCYFPCPQSLYEVIRGIQSELVSSRSQNTI